MYLYRCLERAVEGVSGLGFCGLAVAANRPFVTRRLGPFWRVYEHVREVDGFAWRWMYSDVWFNMESSCKGVGLIARRTVFWGLYLVVRRYSVRGQADHPLITRLRVPAAINRQRSSQAARAASAQSQAGNADPDRRETRKRILNTCFLVSHTSSCRCNLTFTFPHCYPPCRPAKSGLAPDATSPGFGA